MRFTGPRCAAVFIIQLVLIKSCKAECDAVRLDYEGLKRDMNTKLHGQHLVTSTVMKSIQAHTNDPYPGKPLVLSFHGWTGVGKNFVTQIIRDNLYKKEASRHFHLFNSVIHFKDKSKVAKYKVQLHSLLYQNVTNCARSMFVFDEVDKMPTGLIDVLTPFLSPNTEIDGVDYRKTIFLFLSNTGGDTIMDIVFKHWENSAKRESLRLSEMQHALEDFLKLSEMQHALEMVAYNEKSGLKNSHLIHDNLIDHFVPFLPLERIHVRSCIVDLVKQKGYKGLTEDIIEKVLDELGWQPKDVKMFSKTGCKEIERNVAIMLKED